MAAALLPYVFRLGSGAGGVAELGAGTDIPVNQNLFAVLGEPLTLDGGQAGQAGSALYPAKIVPTKITLTFLEDGGGDNDRGHFFWNSSKSTMDPCGPWRKDQSNIKTCAAVPVLNRGNRRPLAQ
jgi:hypothetical protein